VETCTVLQINFVNFAENIHTVALVANCIFESELYVLLSVLHVMRCMFM